MPIGVACPECGGLSIGVRMKRLLLVFDKFKDALEAESVCAEVARAVRARCPGTLVQTAPLTDGGEGFVDILTGRAGGIVRQATVCGPRLQPVEAAYGRVDLEGLPGGLKRAFGLPESGYLAIIEMARASGLQLLDGTERDPWVTTSFGTGELMTAAAREGVSAILLGVGGSATQDLGLGALAALGLRREPPADGGHPGAGFVPAEWGRIEAFSGEGLLSLPPVRIACDVGNPLLGERGAVHTFARQKGATDADLTRLEAVTGEAAEKLCRAFGVPADVATQPGAGAAGGIGFGLQVACGARRISGYDLVAEWLGLDGKIEAADLVITGEGRFDAGSLAGKGPGRVVKRALERGKKVVVLAGAVALSAAERAALEDSGAVLEAVTPEGMALDEALPRTGALLGAAVNRVLSRLEAAGGD